MSAKMKLAILAISIGIIISASTLCYYYMYNNKPDNEPANLKLEISFPKETFFVNESLPITIKLTNYGNHSVTVSEMALELGTLDLKIRTPDGLDIDYGGPYVNCIPRPKSIAPGKQMIVDCDLTKTFQHNNSTYFYHSFGFEGLDNGTWFSSQYNFTHSGNYTVQGIYTSGNASGETWHGTVMSNVGSFKINS